MSLDIQSLLRDRYRILKVLAQSGMGTVYLAHDEVLNVDIALKENLYTTEAHSHQFRLEATILARLRHPNLPRVIDHFVLQDQGEYLVMDYIDGEDLQERLARLGEPLSEETVARIGVVMSEALSYLHSCTPPIIHRDIKPANLKLTPEGHVVLVDFGLAKQLTQGEMTAVGAQGITAGYSPVEQYGQGTDACSDIYALGATLYTLLTQQIPPEALKRAIGEDCLLPISAFNRAVSPELESVVAKAMAVKAEDRYPSANVFQDALLSAHPLHDFSNSKPVVQPIERTRQVRIDSDSPKTLQVPQQKKPSAAIWLIPVLIVLMVAAVGAGFIFGNGGSSTPPPVQPPAALPTDVAVVSHQDSPAPTEEPNPTEAVPISDVAPTADTAPEAVGTPQGGGQGQIAFVSERSGNPQIYLMNSDGSDVTPLTDEPEGACQPAWSPDGQSLAYISPCAGLKERYDGASLFILNLASGRSDLISTFATGDYDPAWSPDGARLAFTSLQTGKPQIFIYSFDSKSAQILMQRSTNNRMPAWSPDGQLLVFVSPSPVTNRPILFTVDAQGLEEPRGVMGQNYDVGLRPAWSPEGELLLFDLDAEPVLGGRSLINNQDVPIATSLKKVAAPEFSPDGNWILCEGVDENGSREIFVMMRTGARLAPLTENPAEDYQPAWRP